MERCIKVRGQTRQTSNPATIGGRCIILSPVATSSCSPLTSARCRFRYAAWVIIAEE